LKPGTRRSILSKLECSFLSLTITKTFKVRRCRQQIRNIDVAIDPWASRHNRTIHAEDVQKAVLLSPSLQKGWLSRLLCFLLCVSTGTMAGVSDSSEWSVLIWYYEYQGHWWFN
jgi:hypothetical protein